MTSEPAFYVGILLLVTGVACGGVGALLGSRYVLVAVGGIPFLVAGALLVYVARERHRFRVTEVEFSPIGDYAGPCPGEHDVLVRVDTVGGAGRVAFRVWAGDDFDSPLQTVQVRPNVGFDYVTTVSVTETGFATAYATVEKPTTAVASQAFSVSCTTGG